MSPEPTIQNLDMHWILGISFTTPHLIGSGFGYAGQVDMTAVRDARGCVYIPASSLRGKIRSEFRKVMLTLDGDDICRSRKHPEMCRFASVAKACVMCRVFGSETYESGLIVSDGRLDDETRRVLASIDDSGAKRRIQIDARSGVRLDRSCRTAAEGGLFRFDSVNLCLTFKATIMGSAHITNDEKEWLQQTILRITHLGSGKARGLGRCAISVEEVK